MALGQGFAKLQQHLEEHTDIVKSTAILFKMTNFENLIRIYKKSRNLDHIELGRDEIDRYSPNKV